MTNLEWIIAIIIAFAIGSIPFGALIARAYGINLREVGSGNTGATNVSRALGRGWGFGCFLLDAAKGAGPVLVTGFLGETIGKSPAELTPGEEWGWILVGLGAMLGHIYSPFLRFKGGKGVATAFGAFGAMWPLMSLPIIAAGVVFLIVKLASGYMSLASIIAGWAMPASVVVIALLDEASTVGTTAPPFLIGVTIASLVTWRHRSNIARLRAGTEPRSGKPEQAD